MSADRPGPAAGAKKAADAKPGQALAQRGDGDKGEVAASDDAPRSKLSWLVGWVLMPGTVLGLIFGSGALLGAHMHDSWFTRAIVWVVALFA